MTDAILRVENLKTHFRTRRARVRAVDGVSFEIRRGETLALVGESGCGKTTVGHTIVGLTPATEGEITLDGIAVRSATASEKRRVRTTAQIIFQDPVGALDPRRSIRWSVGEGLRLQRMGDAAFVDRTVVEMLDRVGLPQSQADRHPHELSGGQLQRAVIARALAVRPSLLVCDEPLSALDVSIQAQITNLLLDIQEADDVAYLFISHDLSVVRHVADRVAVMYLGRIVEISSTERVLNDPQHPYTRALIAAIPDRSRRRSRPVLTAGSQSSTPPATGCSFAPRCPEVQASCREAEPELGAIAGSVAIAERHEVACFVRQQERS